MVTIASVDPDQLVIDQDFTDFDVTLLITAHGPSDDTFIHIAIHIAIYILSYKLQYK